MQSPPLVRRRLRAAGRGVLPLLLAAQGREVEEGPDAGSEFVDVLMAMVAWGDRWTAGDAGPPVLYRHRACGQITHVVAHCAACGEILRSADVDVEPGPGLAAAS